MTTYIAQCVNCQQLHSCVSSAFVIVFMQWVCYRAFCSITSSLLAVFAQGSLHCLNRFSRPTAVSGQHLIATRVVYLTAALMCVLDQGGEAGSTSTDSSACVFTVSYTYLNSDAVCVCVCVCARVLDSVCLLCALEPLCSFPWVNIILYAFCQFPWTHVCSVLIKYMFLLQGWF